MRAVILSAVAVAGAMGVPANASVMIFGNSYAVSCYRYAEARTPGVSATHDCDVALSQELLNQHDRAGTLVNRGILHLVARNLTAAEQDFDAAIATDPNQADAWLNKSIATVRRGDSVAALPLVDRAMALGTTKPALAHYIRAVAHEDSGNLRAAYADLLKARDLEPGWSIPAQELTRFKVVQ